MYLNNYNDLINKILNSIDIVEYISKKINLFKKGNYFFSICPFHKEKTPSFSVDKNKKFYYCFGCKSYGNIINFLMNFENISFKNSIKKLSSELNIDYKFIKNYNKLDINKKENIFLYKCMNYIKKIYQNNLLLSNNNLELKKYFNKKKWSDNILEEFGIGYSSNTSTLNIKKKFYNKYSILFKLGIFYKKNNNIINLFENRIIFTIYDINGNVSGFGGRIINNNIKPKYINSFNNKIFNKSSILYGLYNVKKKNNNISKLLLVEGYTDVISLHNFGINYSVSTLGCSLSKEHIKLIFENTNNIIFCYDGDNAGYISSLRSFKKILPYLTDDIKINFIILPKNEDPDSIINKIGKNKFNNLIKKSIDISAFIFKFILNINLKKSIYYNIKSIKKFINIIDIIPGKLLKFFLKKKICYLFKISLFDLNNLFNKNKKYNLLENLNKNKNNPFHFGISLIINNPLISNKIYIPKDIYLTKDINIKIITYIVYISKKYNLLNKYELFKKIKNSIFIKNLLRIYNNTVIPKNINIDSVKNILNKINILILKNNQDILILREKKYGLNIIEKKKLILINKKIFKLSKDY